MFLTNDTFCSIKNDPEKKKEKNDPENLETGRKYRSVVVDIKWAF